MIRFDISSYCFSTEEDWENKGVGRYFLLFRVSSALFPSLFGVVEHSVS
jgi:hypothetical protein